MSQNPAVPRISKTEALREASKGLLHEIRNELIVDTRWNLPFPTVPAAQLLYVPNRVRDIFACPTSAVNHSDIDAMAYGILERLNLNFFATDPHEMKRVRDSVSLAEQKYETFVAKLRASGKAVNPIPEIIERYYNLEAEDAELVKEDLGVHPLNEDSLPTGTLLKNHIYTELGRTPMDKRAEERLAAPFARFGLNNNNNSNNIINNAGSSSPDLMGSQQNRASSFLMSMSQQQQQQSQSVAGVGGAKEVASAEEMWVKRVNLTFKNAKQLDALFLSYIDQVGVELIGVGVQNPKPQDRSLENGIALRQAQEAVQKFTRQFLELTLSVLSISEKFARDLVIAFRKVVSGQLQIETAQEELNDSWSHASNEDAILTSTQEVRDRLLSSVLALFAEWELDISEKESIKPFVVKTDKQDLREITNKTEISKVLRAILTKINPANTKDFVSLVNADHIDDVPVAVLPVFPADRKADAPVEDLTARIFLNTQQQHQAGSDAEDDDNDDDDENGRKIKQSRKLFKSKQQQPYHPIVMFGQGDLLLRPDPHASKDNPDVMQYQPETSSFDVLKSDNNADGIYLLKIGQDAARFARVPRTVEYVRRLGTEKATSALETSTVVWEDVAPTNN
jgi:hypothetical protein